MKIVTIQTKDFKGVKDGVHNFTDNNIISGRNGSGKSSIADAIIFTLYGRTRTGNNSADDLIHENAESATVAIEFDTGTTVVREQSRFYGPKIKLNGDKVDQKDLDVSLVDFKTFLSVFLPGYFSSQDESDQRAQILAYSGEIDYKELFNKFTRKPELLKEFDINFNNLDAELKDYKRQKKNLEEMVSSNKRKAEYAAEQIQTIKKPKARVDIAKIQAKLDLHRQWDNYEQAISQNQEIGEQILQASKGTCPSCGQSLSKTEINSRLTELNAKKVEVPDKPTSKRPKTPAHELQSTINEAAATNALYENYEEQILDLEKQKADCTDRAEKAAETLVKVELIVEALSPKGIRASAARQQIKPVLERINEFSPESLPIKIETLQQLKNGNMKEVFKVYANEVPYKYLSTGEQKRVDIAISQAINSFTDDEVNMYFIDDAELISSEYTLTGQVFKAYVTSDDLTIKEG